MVPVALFPCNSSPFSINPPPQKMEGPHYSIIGHAIILFNGMEQYGEHFHMH